MRAFIKSGAMTLAAALIGGTALVSAPAISAAEPFQLAQLQGNEGGAPERDGRGGGAEQRGRGAERGAERGNRGGEVRGLDRAAERAAERSVRGGGEIRGEMRGQGRREIIQGGQARGGEVRMGRGTREQTQQYQRAPRTNYDRASRMQVEQRRTVVRDDRRWDRRYDRRWDRRVVRGQTPFVYLGGPRIIVREFGPGWCRGLHRGYHRAPRIGWHNGTHRGLYRC